MHDTLLLFGATGDLAQRYLFASLLRLLADGLLPAGFRIHGLSRSAHTTDAFRGIVRTRLQALSPSAKTADIEHLLACIDYHSVNLTDPAKVAAVVAELGHGRSCVSYLAIPPELYIPAVRGLARGGLLATPHRLMLEKPIGHDTASARAINHTISELLDEDRVFRLDHYLGKAPVQNLMALRFGNTLLEAVWNRNWIESVDILVSETDGVDGRNAYYATSGALRDMVQSHILQLLCLVAMEPPASLDADRIRDEKVKVLRALRPFTAATAARDSLRARYGAGVIAGQAVPAYVPPPGTDPETLVSVTAWIDNWRWTGVPFHLCTGKRLPERATGIVVTLKPVSHWLFEHPDRASAASNRITFRLQPQENIQLGLLGSLAGPEWGALELQPLELDLSVCTGLHRRIAYERLLLDALHGNHALFVRSDEVEAAWTWIDSIIAAWRDSDQPILSYPAGQWGPPEAARFLPPGPEAKAVAAAGVPS